ncbi:MAG: type II toxin-antitoxin system PemK/MazF family toxin [Candidatus Moranbacteria bacterium]|nr:type II toxin-antitoxin system PemK/MazF family toxin [Candidatus Moranbacteria bacterium]
METYERFEIVKVPFPFTDRPAAKTRPALVLSDGSAFNDAIGQSVMAMITTAHHSQWPLDTPIVAWTDAGLPAASVIRLKLFTLDQRLILARWGRLGTADQAAFTANLKRLLALT